jgi:hypothetical protein
MKYLELYRKWMEQGHIDPLESGAFNGMCHLFEKDELFKLFKPTEAERDEWNCTAYWGCDLTEEDYRNYKNNAYFCKNFTETRQNIVLFMAAMNGEL